MPTTIYALVDPRNDEVRYVGKTRQRYLSSRLRQHITQPHSPIVRAWIESLLEKNIDPEIVAIEVVDDSIWREKELFWISLLKTSEPLLNKSMGGNFQSQEEIINRMIAVRKSQDNEEYKKRNKLALENIRKNPIYAAKKSASMKAFYKTEAGIKRRKEISKNWKPNNKESIQKIRESKLGIPRSEECKRKIRETIEAKKNHANS